MHVRSYLLSALLLSSLLCGRPATGQNSVNSTARLFVRYERAVSGHRISEDLLALRDSVSRKDTTLIAIRVCSKEPLPLAAANAVNPFNLADLLGGYGYTPQQIMFLRSEDCPSASTDTPATEMWVIPEGVALPPHADALKSNELRLVPLGRKPFNRGVRDYKAALNELVRDLQADPDDAGVVFGYFLKSPSPALRRRMREAAGILRRSGLPANRHLVRSRFWNDETSTIPPDSEPTYPSVFLVDVVKNSAVRK